MTPKPETCEGCPIALRSVGFVKPQGPTCAKIALVGQGPGEQEAEFDQPFYQAAPSGRMLDRWLAQAYTKKGRILRSRCMVTNVIWCWLPQRKTGPTRGVGNQTPPRSAIEHCWKAHLGPLLRSMPNLRDVVAIGAPATSFLLGLPEGKAVEKYVGTTNRVRLGDRPEPL